MVDISVILTAHREGVIAGATVRSLLQAIEYAEKTCNLAIEVVAVLDNADVTTTSIIVDGLVGRAKIISSATGDPGQARNRGVQEAVGMFVSFLDGDDLWSYNWLVEGFRSASKRPDAVFHSECNITFGNQRIVWWHVDSEGPLFDPAYLDWGNYWDALSFARRDIYLKFLFKNNDLQAGFGHEDWHWNYVTYLAGLAHKPVPDTIHFKRRRRGSQMSLVERSGSVIWPIEQIDQQQAPVHLAVALPFSGAEQVIDSLSASLGVTSARDESAPPAIRFDPQFGAFSPDDISKLKADLPDDAKILIFVRDPFARAKDEIEHKLFVRGGARGSASDAMFDAAIDATASLAQPMADMVGKWTSAFGARLKAVCIDQIRSEYPATRFQNLLHFLGATKKTSGEIHLEEIYDEPLRPSLTRRQQTMLARMTADDVAHLADIVPFATKSWVERSRDIIETASDEEPQAEGNVAFRRLLRLTESVGDNCEFGFLQRYEDYEPSSLFRWAVTPIDKLVGFLKAPTPLFLTDNLQTTSSDLVLDTLSGFYFHSNITIEDGNARRFLTKDEGFFEIYEKEVEKLDYFVSKLFLNLRSNPGIYIHKRNNPVSSEEFMELALTIKSFNPDHVVLWVTADDELKLERLGDGIYAGTIRKFAEYHTSNLIDLPSWTDILMLLQEEQVVRNMINKASS